VSSQVEWTDITSNPKNANTSTKRGHSLLTESMGEHGWAEAGVLDKHNRIISGKHRSDVAVDMGMDGPTIIDHDPSKPVFLRLNDVDLDTKEGQMLALRLNRVAQASIEWSPEVLYRLAEEGVPLDELWTPNELADVFEDFIGEITGQGNDDDVSPLNMVEQPVDHLLVINRIDVPMDQIEADTLYHKLQVYMTSHGGLTDGFVRSLLLSK